MNEYRNTLVIPGVGHWRITDLFKRRFSWGSWRLHWNIYRSKHFDFLWSNNIIIWKRKIILLQFPKQVAGSTRLNNSNGNFLNHTYLMWNLWINYWTSFSHTLNTFRYVLPTHMYYVCNMTEDFSPKALVIVERLSELLGWEGVASLLLILLKLCDLSHWVTWFTNWL